MWGPAGPMPYGQTTGYGGAPIQPKQYLGRHLGGPSFEQSYGAPFGLSLHLPCFFRQPSIFRTTKKRLNIVAILINLFVPWLLFCLVFWLLSFSLHYTAPWTCWLIVTLLFATIVVPFAILAWVSKMQREKQAEEETTPMWYGFLAVACGVAFLAGMILGIWNFNNNLNHVYDLQNLATYHDIDPADYVGQQMVDAGRIIFNNETHLGISKSMGFKDNDVYCVAPIVSSKTTAATYQDFWAVGKNCCSGTSADFHCEGYNYRFNGGLRLMDDTARPFYRLAVQQAEAMWGIKTHKPLFFIWGPDPIEYTDSLKRAGIAMYTTGILAALVVGFFAVICATLVFAKVYPARDENIASEFPYVY